LDLGSPFFPFPVRRRHYISSSPSPIHTRPATASPRWPAFGWNRPGLVLARSGCTGRRCCWIWPLRASSPPPQVCTSPPPLPRRLHIRLAQFQSSRVSPEEPDPGGLSMDSLHHS
uniref:Uncharacterized protein n=1 Tax=Triticum urartu TaxID=4572 RepID=A0A8R7PF53_TRIUA